MPSLLPCCPTPGGGTTWQGGLAPSSPSQMTAFLGHCPERRFSWEKESFIKRLRKRPVGGCRGAEPCLWCKPALQLGQSPSPRVREPTSAVADGNPTATLRSQQWQKHLGFNLLDPASHCRAGNAPRHCVFICWRANVSRWLSAALEASPSGTRVEREKDLGTRREHEHLRLWVPQHKEGRFLYQTDRITESQNSRGWQGPLWVI